jgi:hypothetical protein
MEQTITDSLGNDITIIYDETTDTLTVKNPAVDEDFHGVTRLDSSKPEMVIVIEGTDGPDSWESWSDEQTRQTLAQIWLDNKKNQE